MEHKKLFSLFLLVCLFVSVFGVFFVSDVYASVSVTPSGSSYILANGRISVKVTAAIVVSVTNVNLSREVGYGYFYFNYRLTSSSSVTSFYLHQIGSWVLTPHTVNSTYVTLECSKHYVDNVGTTHDMYFLFSLFDGSNMTTIAFTESASSNMTQVGLSFESNFYPQGYGSQNSGGSLSVGGNTNYSAPLPYDGDTHVYTSAGNFTHHDPPVILSIYNDIDSYLLGYSSGSVFGVMSSYVDLRNLRFRSLSSGTERQIMWFDSNVRLLDRKTGYVTLYIGVWSNQSYAISNYGSIPYVETLIDNAPVSFFQCVRTDLNIHLYDYNTMFPDILDNILARQNYSMVSSASPATLVAGMSIDYTFFKFRSHPEIWNNVSQDSQEDFVQKSINVARLRGVIVDVELDVTAPSWLYYHPTDSAIGVNGLPYESLNTTGVGGDTCPYWVKLPILVEAGVFHDLFMEGVEYLLHNYNFRALVLSECIYKDADYSNETKSRFLVAYPQYVDFPRLADGSIDIYNVDLMRFKVDYLSIFWDELTSLAHAHGKKFYVMVEPNYLNPSLQGAEYSQNYTSVIAHCDGLWVWAYYGYFGVDAVQGFSYLNQYLYPLKLANPDKKIIFSIGLWGSATDFSSIISVGALGSGIYFLDQHTKWFDGVEVTPSKFMISSDYWSQLWHGDFGLGEDDWYSNMIVTYMVLFIFIIVPPLIIAFEFGKRNVDPSIGFIGGLCLTVPLAYTVHLIDLWVLFVFILGLTLMVLSKLGVFNRS